MEPEQFSLCWNNFHNNLTSGFQALLKDEDLVDVTLAAEGRYIKAHKIVLSVCSPFFKELFQTNPCKHPIVILHDVEFSALNSLMQFMYQGEVSVGHDEIPVFMKVAEILKIKGLTDNNTFNNMEDNTNGAPNNLHNQQPYGESDDQQPTMKRNRPFKKMLRPLQHLRSLESSSPSSSPSSPAAKQPRLDNCKSPVYMEPLLKPKQEPLDGSDEEYIPHGMNDDKSDVGNAVVKYEPGESSENSFGGSATNDASSPGTIQCILGRRGLPRLIVDGYTFFKKSTYKTKCFWYCKTNRQYRCPAVCWTVNGKIIKWPVAHNHAILPEVITPGEDTLVPIEMLKQVLTDAAK